MVGSFFIETTPKQENSKDRYQVSSWILNVECRLNFCLNVECRFEKWASVECQKKAFMEPNIGIGDQLAKKNLNIQQDIWSLTLTQGPKNFWWRAYFIICSWFYIDKKEENEINKQKQQQM